MHCKCQLRHSNSCVSREQLDEVQINYDRFAVGSWRVSKQRQEMSSSYCGARPPRVGTLQTPSYSKDRAIAAKQLKTPSMQARGHNGIKLQAGILVSSNAKGSLKAVVVKAV